MLKTTAFHERTAPLCASLAWRRWAGHVVASSYELTHEREYHVIRTAAALFDVSPLYKYLVRGRDERNPRRLRGLPALAPDGGTGRPSCTG